MSEPLSGTGTAATALTGVSLYGLFAGTDYGVVFGAFAGSTFYITTASNLGYFKRIALFVVSFISGVLCSGLVGAKLSEWTGYIEKPLDALGAVIISTLAVRLLTVLSNYDFRDLFERLRRGNGDANK